MIHILKELSEMKKDIMKILTNKKNSSLQEKFLFIFYNKFLIYIMNSIVKLRFVSISQRFCVQKNSSIINERKYLQISCSFTFLSILKKMIILFSFFQHLK